MGNMTLCRLIPIEKDKNIFKELVIAKSIYN
jgi:hypothetical protein